MQSQTLATKLSFAFVFGPASGHINPSLPLARCLVGMGHEVHYLSRPAMKSAIEDTGATYSSDFDWESELYEGREIDLYGALEYMKKEFNQENEKVVVSMTRLMTLSNRLMLPGLIRFLKHFNASLVVYCPFMNAEGGYAAKALNIPSVSLMTTAGPGSIYRSFQEFLKLSNTDEVQLREALESFEPHRQAVADVNDMCKINLPISVNMNPLGKLDVLSLDIACLVTTCEDLADPCTPEVEAANEKQGARFVYVGPLLDKEGACRATTHKGNQLVELQRVIEKLEPESESEFNKELLQKIKASKAAGRRVIFSSMGTVVTGDHPQVGWNALMPDSEQKPHGLTGRELCQSAWGGLLDAYGAKSEEEGPLLVMAVGQQEDALGDLTIPPNAVTMPSAPQVDILRAGVDVFLSHGGQNSFMEGLGSGAAFVVCPGFADQPVNARKAQDMGVGLAVERPWPQRGEHEPVMEKYRADVSEALKRVMEEPRFIEKAKSCAERMAKAGGVNRALEVILEAAHSGRNEKEEVTTSSLDKHLESAAVQVAVGGA